MIRFLKQPSSEQVAAKMLSAVEGFGNKLQKKSDLSSAEKRHLMRLRATAVLDSSQVVIKKKK